MDDDIAYYSWHEQFYYFNLFRTLNGPDATPGRDSHTAIDDSTYYTQADLSAWIREQNVSRKAFLDGKASSLSENQIKVLDRVSFPWVRDSSERWDGHFRDLVEYKRVNGHCNVPRRSGGKLGVWVKNQRAAYHKLMEEANGGGLSARRRDSTGEGVKKTTAVITPDQIKLLTDLGFQWKIREDHAATWENHFASLTEFASKHGHCNVSPKEHPTLGRWVCEMRARYRKKAAGEKCSVLTEEQISRLEGIEGFKWKRIDPEERKRRAEEAARERNERLKKERMEARLKRKREKEEAAAAEKAAKKKRRAADIADAKKKKKQSAAAKAALKKPIKKGSGGTKPKSTSKTTIPASMKNIAVERMKGDIERKLAALKGMEEERVKNRPDLVAMSVEKPKSTNNKTMIPESIKKIAEEREKGDMERKLAALKKTEEERAKNHADLVAKSVDGILNDIDEKLAAEDICQAKRP